MTPFPRGTNLDKAIPEGLAKFILTVFKDPDYKKNLGGKELTVIGTGQNEPLGPYVRITRLGGTRPPWSMAYGPGEPTFLNYELRYTLDVVVPTTDSKVSDEKKPSLTLKNRVTDTNIMPPSSGGMASDICFTLMTVFEVDKWRDWLSSNRIHNSLLVDQREFNSGMEYKNPLSLTVDGYVYV